MSCAPWVFSRPGSASASGSSTAQWWAERRQQMMTAVQRWAAEHDIAAGMPLETLRQQVGLPAAELVPPLLDGTGLEVADGLVRQPDTGLPPRVDKAVRTVEEWLAAEPFRAPEADELKELKLGTQELAAAVRVGRLTKIADGVVLGRRCVRPGGRDPQDAAAAVHRQRRPPRAGNHPPGRGAVARTA